METIIKYNRPKGNQTSVSNLVGGSGNYYGIGDVSDTSTIDINIDDKLLWKTSEGDMSLTPKNSYNYAYGESSVAIGTFTNTLNEGEFALGVFNNPISGETLFTIGNGTSDANRSNVFRVGRSNTVVSNNFNGTTANFSTSVISPIVSGQTAVFNNGTFYTGITTPSATISAITANTIEVNNKLTTDQIEAVSGYIQTLLSENITVDNLTVTKAAHFFKLIIDEIKATQGQIIITPTNAVIDKVVNYTNYFRCYFKAKDDDNEIVNGFEVNDQIVCQTFNAATGVSYNVSNTYYWRLCVSTGTTTTTIDGENVECHYIDLSKTDKDTLSNSDPKRGDNVVQLGNRSDTTRQAAIIISAYNTQFLDKNIKAPSIVQYYGINDYNLEAHRRNVISRDFNEFKGSFKTSTGDDIEQMIEDVTSGATTYLHTAWANSADGSVDFTKDSSGQSYNYIGLCTNHNQSDNDLIYSDYTWSYVHGESGTSGTDAEFYRLTPVKEIASVNKNDVFGVSLQYQIVHVSGNTTEVITATTSGYWVRFKRDDSNSYYNLSTGTTTPSYSQIKMITNYHTRENKPTYLTVELVSGSSAVVKDKKVVNIIFEAGATLTVADEINATVQGNSDNIEALSGTVSSHTNSIAQLNISYSAISASVESHTTSIQNISGDVNTVSGQVQTNTDNIASLTQTSSSLTSTVSSHTQSINTLTNSVSANTTSISQLEQTSSSLTSSINTINGYNHRNYFAFNRGIKPYNNECMLYAYEYGFVGWGSLDRIYNFNFTSDDLNYPWTLTFQIIADATVTVSPQFCDVAPIKIFKGTEEQTNHTSLTATTSWVTYRVFFDNINSSYLTDAANNGFLDFEKSNTARTITLRYICLTKGHYKELQFEKAPEDINFQGGQQQFKWGYSFTQTNGTFRGLPIYENTKNPTENDPYVDYITSDYFSIKDKTPYTLSFWAKSNSANTYITSYFYNGAWNLHLARGNTTNNGADGAWNTFLTTEWKHYTVKWLPHVNSITGTDATQKYIKRVIAFRLPRNLSTNNQTAIISIAGVTFQEGWIEDGTGSQSSLIQQTADNILLQVGECGINIDEQNITLNGDTQVNGTLTLTDDDQGFLLVGDGGKTQITPTSLGTYSNFTTASTNNYTVSKQYQTQVQPWAPTESSTTASWFTTNNFGIVQSGSYIPLSGQTSFFRNVNSGNALIPISITNTYKIYINDSLVSTITNSTQSVTNIGSYTTSAKGTLRIDRLTYATFRTANLINNSVIGHISYVVQLPREMFTLIGYDGIGSNFGTNSNVYFGSEGSYFRYGNYGINISNNGIKKLVGNSWLPLNYLNVVRTSNSTYNLGDSDKQQIEMLVTTSSSSQTIILPKPSTCIGRRIYIKCNGSGSPKVYCDSTGNTTKYFVSPTSNYNDILSFTDFGSPLRVFISDGTYWQVGYQG